MAARGYRQFASRVNAGAVPGLQWIPASAREAAHASIADRRLWFETILRHRLWFIERHYMVARKEDEKRIPMKLSHNGRKLVRLWLWQTYVLRKPVRWIILKYRQGFFSTTIAALVHSEAKYGLGGNHLLTGSEKDPDIETIYGKIQYIEEHMTDHPDLFVPTMGSKKTGSKNGIGWQYWDAEAGLWRVKGGGVIVPKSGAFQSKTGRTFWGTEIGKPRRQKPEWEQLFKYSIQAIPSEPGTSVFLEGTATGPRGFLWDLWRERDDATAGQKYDFLFFPFYTHEEYRLPVIRGVCEPEPAGNTDAERADDEREMKRLRAEYDAFHHLDRCDPKGWRYRYLVTCREEAINWRQHVGIPDKCKGDTLFFRHEYPATPEEAFVGSGRGVYDEKKIMVRIDGIRKREEARKAMVPRPAFPGFIDAEFTTYIIHPPTPGDIYVAGGDTSRGIKPNTIKEGETKRHPGGDPLVLTLYNVTKRRVEAVWSGWKPVPQAANDWIDLAAQYNDALLIVERTGGTGGQMNDILVGIRDDPKDPRNPNVYYHWNDPQAGFKLDRGNREKAVELIAEFLDMSEYEDLRFWQELYNFGPDNTGKLVGLDKSPDDRVMSIPPIAHWMKENGEFLHRQESRTPYGQMLAEKLSQHEQAAQDRRKDEMANARPVREAPFNYGDPLCRFMPRAKRPGVTA